MAMEMRFGKEAGFSFGDGAGFIRALGWVLLIKTPKFEPLFSERYGHAKHYGIGGYRVRLQRVKYIKQ
jgi:hypothetical protein